MNCSIVQAGSRCSNMPQPKAKWRMKSTFGGTLHNNRLSRKGDLGQRCLEKCADEAWRQRSSLSALAPVVGCEGSKSHVDPWPRRCIHNEEDRVILITLRITLLITLHLITRQGHTMVLHVRMAEQCQLSTAHAQQRIGELVGDRRLEKYCVWFLAALAGMPFVVQVSLGGRERAECTVRVSSVFSV